MIVEIFGSIQYVEELSNSITVEGDRLYVFLRQYSKDEKTYYEYLGSMLSTLEVKTTAFISAFLDVATHYALPAGQQNVLLDLKKQLDENDRALVFEGKDAV